MSLVYDMFWHAECMASYWMAALAGIIIIFIIITRPVINRRFDGDTL